MTDTTFTTHTSHLIVALKSGWVLLYPLPGQLLRFVERLEYLCTADLVFPRKLETVQLIAQVRSFLRMGSSLSLFSGAIFGSTCGGCAKPSSFVRLPVECPIRYFQASNSYFLGLRSIHSDI